MKIVNLFSRLALPTVLAAATVSSAGTASAAGLSVQDAFTLFNGISQGNFKSNQEVEGRLYVGGSLSGSNIQVGFTPVVPSSYDDLIVNGSTTIGTINMQDGSDMTVRGNVDSNVNMNGSPAGTATIGGTQSAGKSFNTGTKLENQSGVAGFDARFPEIDFGRFTDESSYLATLAGVAPDLSDNNNKKFVAGTPDADGLFVMTTTIAALNGGGITVDAGSATTFVINVSGTSGTVSANVLGGSASASKVIWNFHEATAISVNSAIIGSVLAPLADMSGFQGSTEGSVIAKSIDLSNGELHNRGFTGTVPTAMPAPPAVPLPAALPLLAGGLMAFGGLRALRKRPS